MLRPNLTKISKEYLQDMVVQLRIIELITNKLLFRRRILTLSLVLLRDTSGFLSCMDLKSLKICNNKDTLRIKSKT